MNKKKTTRGQLKARLMIALLLVACLCVMTLVLVSCKKKPSDTGTTTAGPSQTRPPSVTADGYISLSDVTLSGGAVYASDATGNALYKFAADGGMSRSYEASASVNAVTADSGKIYAAVGGLDGRLIVLSEDLEVEREIKVGHTPNAVLIEGGYAYVANRFSCSVSVVDLSGGKVISEISVSREPMALACAGGKVYVACHLPDDRANADKVSASISVIDTKTNTFVKNIELVNGAGNVKDIVAAHDGKKLYLSHIVSRYQYPTTQLDAGWVNTNAVTIIDASTDAVDYTFLLDDIEHGAANPWGIEISDDGNLLYCVLSGTDELVRVELSKLDTLVSKLGKSTNKLPISSKEEIVNYIPFAKDAKTRIDLGGKGARALARSGGKLYVAHYFSGEVTVVDEDKFAVSGSLTVAKQPTADEARMGEIYWNDATICYQNWQSCASCHPEARSGGFNWDELGDGVGTMKQTKSMVYVMRTPPCLATGLESNGEHGVAGSVSGTPLWNKSEDAEKISNAMIAYLRSLAPVSSPYLNDDGTLTAAASHGKELFESYGCAACHPAPLYTDLKLHDSPTLEFDDSWEYRQMDTPTLVEVWRSYPWSYIGQFTDMKDIVKYFVENFSKKTISDADAADLAEFVLSIGAEGEDVGVEQVILDDGTYNKVTSGRKITSISLIGQSDVPDENATVKIVLCDKDGGEIARCEMLLGSLKIGERRVLILESPIEITDNTQTVSVSIDGTAVTTLTLTR